MKACAGCISLTNLRPVDPSTCTRLFAQVDFKLSQRMTKPTKCHMHPAKTQISLGIRPVWSVVRWIGSLGTKLSSCGQRRLWSAWADAQADLSLRWAHMPFCRWLNLYKMRLHTKGHTHEAQLFWGIEEDGEQTMAKQNAYLQQSTYEQNTINK